jgi:hypothetical protein
MPSPQTVPFLRIDLKSLPLTMGTLSSHASTAVLTHAGMGTGRTTAGFAHKVHNRPVILATLNGPEFKPYDLRAPQTAAEQQRIYCRIKLSPDRHTIKA